MTDQTTQNELQRRSARIVIALARSDTLGNTERVDVVCDEMQARARDFRTVNQIAQDATDFWKAINAKADALALHDSALRKLEVSAERARVFHLCEKIASEREAESGLTILTVIRDEMRKAGIP